MACTPTPPTNPCDFGAVGDGVADDTAAINAAVAAAPVGGAVYIDEGTYLVVANPLPSNGKHEAVNIDKALRFEMDVGAEIVLQANNYPTYAVIEVKADDVQIVGGKITGDGLGHSGNTGANGFGIKIAGERITVRDSHISLCTGDGIFVGALWGGQTGDSKDVSIINCVLDNNGRQGISIVDGERIQVLGGSITNTGAILNQQPPHLGIDIEPELNNEVLECVIDGVAFSGNVGGAVGVLGLENGPIEVTVSNCVSSNDGHNNQFGSAFGGGTGTFLGCTAIASAASGFASTQVPGSDPAGKPWSPPAVFRDCTAIASAYHGFAVHAVSADPNYPAVADTDMGGCTARENGIDGFHIGSASTRVRLSDCAAINNGKSSTGQSYSIWGSDHVLQDCFATAGSDPLPTVAYNYVLRPGSSGHRLRNCTAGAAGTTGGGQFLNQSTGSDVWPVPAESPLRFPLGLLGSGQTTTDQVLSNSGVFTNLTGLEVTVDRARYDRSLRINWNLAVSSNVDGEVAILQLQDETGAAIQQWNVRCVVPYYIHDSGYALVDLPGNDNSTPQTTTYRLAMKRGYSPGGANGTITLRATTDRKATILVEDLDG